MSLANANIHSQTKRKMKEGKEEDQVAGPDYLKRKREEENRERTQFMNLLDDCVFEISPYLGLAERKNLRRIGNERLVRIEKKSETQFMDLSNDDFFQLFPYLGLAERRNLRRIGNRRLATIEILCKYHYNELQICVNALVCDGVEIKMNEEEMKEELEILKHKTTFNRVICERSDPYDNVKADEIHIYGITNADLPRVFANRKYVFIMESRISADASWWIYKGMLNGDLAVKYVKVDMTDEDTLYYEMWHILDLEDDEDVPREGQEFTRLEGALIVHEEHLKISFIDSDDADIDGGCVFFDSR